GRPDLAAPLGPPRVALPDLGVLEHEDVLHRPEEAGLRVYREPDVDELVRDLRLVVEQPLEPRPDVGAVRLGDGLERALLDPGHHLGPGGDVARRVEDQSVDALRVVSRHPCGDPAAQRLAGDVSALDAEGVEQGDDVVAQVVDRVRHVRLTGEAVPDHVADDHPEPLGQSGHVAHERLEVAARAVQEEERRPVAGLQDAGRDPAGGDEAQAEAGAADVLPEAPVRGRRPGGQGARGRGGALVGRRHQALMRPEGRPSRTRPNADIAMAGLSWACWATAWASRRTRCMGWLSKIANPPLLANTRSTTRVHSCAMYERQAKYRTRASSLGSGPARALAISSSA